jgi:hypothetical protein
MCVADMSSFTDFDCFVQVIGIDILMGCKGAIRIVYLCFLCCVCNVKSVQM